ncbi:MAG: ThuA domain-containing protein [Acidobacteria bacterium]|nr:ThuA domain-containing protein [Acidobacteriota bacterium]
MTTTCRGKLSQGDIQFLCNTRKSMLTHRLIAITTVLLGSGVAPAQTAVSPDPLKILLITGGHPFEEDAFTEMFRSIKNVSFTHVRLGGDAERKLKPEEAKTYDALVFYDMNQRCEAYLNDLLALMEQGKGAVFLHHAIGSCPDNAEYGYLVGGRARFGKPPGSAITTAKFKANTSYRAHIEDRNSAITMGMSDFDVTDEVYSNYFVNTDAHVFLTSDNPLSARQLAWTWQYKKSPIVYIQLGHDHVTYENPSYRSLVERAIFWVSGRLANTAGTAVTMPGEKLYGSLGCAPCHGNDARGARGPDLKSPVLWSRGDAKQHVVDVIKNGVRGTEMPPYANVAADWEIRELATFLGRSALASRKAISADVRRGREVYHSVGCAECHGPTGREGSLGPELTSLVTSKGVDYLKRKIRQPGSDTPFNYATVSVVTKDGRHLTGVRRNEDTFSLQMVDRSGRLHLFLKDELRNVIHERKSMMPAYDESRLPPDALLDLLAYLQNASD